MNNINFGKRFKQLRQELDLNQQELINDFNKKHHFNFNRVAISQYENGKRIPEIEALTSFAEYFNVSVDYLLGRTDKRDLDNNNQKENNNLKLINDKITRLNKSLEGLSDNAITQINEYIELIRLKENSYRNNSFQHREMNGNMIQAQ